jgi:hypothetical protein
MRVLCLAVVAAALALDACGGAQTPPPPPPPAFAETESTPGESASGVATDATIVVLFNRAPDLSSVTAVFSPAATATIAASPGGVSITASLAVGTSYTLSINARDTSGQALATPFVLHFATAVPVVDLSNPPPAPANLFMASRTDHTLTIGFNAVPANGVTLQGAATSYSVYYAEAIPPISLLDCSGLTIAAPHVTVDVSAAPPNPGEPVMSPGVAVGGLPEAAVHCVAATATNAAGLVSPLSIPTQMITDLDRIPPGPVVILPPQPGDGASNNATLRWIAPADDGTDPASGPVTRYTGFYVAITQEQAQTVGCSAIDFNSIVSGVSPQPAPPYPGPGSLVTVHVFVLNNDRLPACFWMLAFDAVNFSQTNLYTLVTDTTPPAAVEPLVAQDVGGGSVALLFTDVGEDGNTGTATAYRVGFTASGCGGFDLDTATPVTGLPAPQVAGTPEVLTVSGLAPASTYCLGLAVIDSAGNVSPTSTVQATTGP